MSDLVTICVPTYRRPTQLLHALHSCLVQDHRPLEIDIGDDSPNTDSESLVGSLTVPEGINVRYTRNTPGLGQAGNVNALLENARGRALVVLHDDDVLAPGAVAAMYAAFAASPDVVAVYGLQDVISESGELDARKSAELNVRYKRSAKTAGLQRDPIVAAFGRQFPNDGYLVESAAARAIRFRSFEEIGESCDTDFSIRLALEARDKAFFLLDRTTSRYRLNTSALSGSQDIGWRFYNYLTTLRAGLSPEQIRARNTLLREKAAQSVVENALAGRRIAALRILLSGNYPIARRFGPVKFAYHAALIAVPQLGGFRRRARRVVS